MLEHLAYLPTSLKLRLLDCFADCMSEASLTNDGAKELLGTDLDEMADGDYGAWSDNCLDRESRARGRRRMRGRD